MGPVVAFKSAAGPRRLSWSVGSSMGWLALCAGAIFSGTRKKRYRSMAAARSALNEMGFSVLVRLERTWANMVARAHGTRGVRP